jgi:hypothetical protein
MICKLLINSSQLRVEVRTEVGQSKLIFFSDISLLTIKGFRKEFALNQIY